MKTKKILSGGVENRQNIDQITLVDRTTVDESHINPAENPAVLSKNRQELTRFDKKSIVCVIIGLIGLAGGITCLIFGALASSKVSEVLTFPQLSSNTDSDVAYSKLTGEALTDASLVDAPTYCVQTPNGTDGARPQVGLTDAGVVFEAIAEAGITRFAAIYQNPSIAIIGPIRSLRIYYLQWDTPFDCTIVHAGGADDALAAVAAGGYKDLSEDYTYMYRGTYGSRLWNNLFTTSAYLKQYSADHGYNTSNIQGFKRMTPEESNKARIDAGVQEKLNIVRATSADTSEMTARVTGINLNLGGWDNFNVRYDYDASTNTYNRGYASGIGHDVYTCAAEDLGERNPEDICSMAQLSPAVVVAMVVQESKASDGYHEDIAAIGSGRAYIFQNGTAIAGTWNKSSVDEQIKFIDESGAEIALAPGQTFITAVPAYGSIEY